jgi:hypothetical protein
MTSRVSQKQCRLRLNATGVRELCPGGDCVFWEDGGSIVEAGCAIERLGVPVERQPELAQHLLELRLAAQGARDEAERRDAYRRFSELLNLNRE